MIHDYFTQALRAASPVLVLTALSLSLVASAKEKVELTETRGSIAFDYIGYTGDIPANRESQFPTLMGRWQGKHTDSIFDMGANAHGIVALNSAYYFVDINEGYLGTSQYLSPFQVHAGRKLETWNLLDEKWGLGIWHPINRWDYLRTEAVGLIGLFASYKSSWVQWRAFFSPMYIPERGLPVDYSDGKLSSPSPWFLSPASNLRYQNEKIPIRYTIKVPEASSIVQHSGGGTYLRIGEKEGFFASSAWGIMPVNQLLIKFSAKLKVPDNVLEATIYPRVVYHQVNSFDTGYQNEKLKVWFSSLLERPMQEDTKDPEFTYQEIQNALAFSGNADYQMISGADETWLNLGLLRVYGADAIDSGKFASGTASFESRYPFKDSIVVGIKTQATERIIPHLSFEQKVLNDFIAEGAIFSTKFTYTPNSQWSFNLGADVLASQRGADTTSNDFISNYRANNRVTGGCTYAF